MCLLSLNINNFQELTSLPSPKINTLQWQGLNVHIFTDNRLSSADQNPASSGTQKWENIRLATMGHALLALNFKKFITFVLIYFVHMTTV